MLKEIVLHVLLILHFTSAEDCSHTSPCTPLKGGQPFKNPTQIFSARQNNHVQLTVDIHEVTIDWLTVKRRLYNGEFPGPTIWIRPGEVLNVEFVNNLKTPDPPKTDAGFGYPNTTNLHTHGLHISGMSPGDNPVYTVAPGDVYQYVFEVHPDQQPGTFWYHPHFHGSVFFQVLGGMKGALIVEDSMFTTPEIEAVSCPFNCEHDIQIMFMLFQYSSSTGADYAHIQRSIGDYEGFRQKGIQLDNSQQTLEEWLEDPANNIKYMLVNGLLNPVLEIQPGQMKRLRLLNSGEHDNLAIEIENTIPGAPTCEVKEIAKDGIYLDYPRTPRLGRTFIPPGSRVDWLIVCHHGGTFEMRSKFYDEDEMSLGKSINFDGPLMTLKVHGTPANSRFPPTLPAKPDFLRDLRNVAPDEVGGRFQLELNSNLMLARESYSGAYYRYKAELNTVQEWFITNTDTVSSHPLHIHVNYFQVISYNAYTGPYSGGSSDGWRLYDQATGETCVWQFDGYDPDLNIEKPSDPYKYLGHEQNQDLSQEGTIAYVEPGDWRDTFTVPPMSNITIRFKTDSYTGLVVAHCHILNHEDLGMMLAVEIVEQGESLDANLDSGGAYPGSCMDNPEPLVASSRKTTNDSQKKQSN